VNRDESRAATKFVIVQAHPSDVASRGIPGEFPSTRKYLQSESGNARVLSVEMTEPDAISGVKSVKMKSHSHSHSSLEVTWSQRAFKQARCTDRLAIGTTRAVPCESCRIL